MTQVEGERSTPLAIVRIPHILCSGLSVHSRFKGQQHRRRVRRRSRLLLDRQKHFLGCYFPLLFFTLGLIIIPEASPCPDAFAATQCKPAVIEDTQAGLPHLRVKQDQQGGFEVAGHSGFCFTQPHSSRQITPPTFPVLRLLVATAAGSTMETPPGPFSLGHSIDIPLL